MTLYKTVATADGLSKQVACSPEEEAAIRAEWAANEAKAPTASAKLKAHAAMRRWEREQGGITLPGNIMVATDTAAQVKIAELRRRVAAGEVAVPFSFKAASGWVDLSEATIIAVDQAVAVHIQDCYATERQISDAIDAGTVTTTAEIDAIFVAAAAGS